MFNDLKTKELMLSDIKPYEKNPRNNSRAIPAIKKSILENTYLVPLVVDKNNVIVCGHTRFQAMLEICTDKDLNPSKEKIQVIDASHLSAAKIKAFRLIDNKTHELSFWDYGMLTEEIRGLMQSEEYDLSGYGWTDTELAVIGNETPPDLEYETNGISKDNADVTDNFAPNAEDYMTLNFGEDLPKIKIHKETYFAWADKIKTQCAFDDAAVKAELGRMLGISFI